MTPQCRRCNIYSISVDHFLKISLTALEKYKIGIAIQNTIDDIVYENTTKNDWNSTFRILPMMAYKGI